MRNLRRVAPGADASGHAAKALESGDVKVVIDNVYELSQAADAVAHMLGHHARGKVVIAA